MCIWSKSKGNKNSGIVSLIPGYMIAHYKHCPRSLRTFLDNLNYFQFITWRIFKNFTQIHIMKKVLPELKKCLYQNKLSICKWSIYLLKGRVGRGITERENALVHSLTGFNHWVLARPNQGPEFHRSLSCGLQGLKYFCFPRLIGRKLDWPWISQDLNHCSDLGW